MLTSVGSGYETINFFRRPVDELRPKRSAGRRQAMPVFEVFRDTCVKLNWFLMVLGGRRLTEAQSAEARVCVSVTDAQVLLQHCLKKNKKECKVLVYRVYMLIVTCILATH